MAFLLQGPRDWKMAERIGEIFARSRSRIRSFSWGKRGLRKGSRSKGKFQIFKQTEKFSKPENSKVIPTEVVTECISLREGRRDFEAVRDNVEASLKKEDFLLEDIRRKLKDKVCWCLRKLKERQKFVRFFAVRGCLAATGCSWRRSSKAGNRPRGQNRGSQNWSGPIKAHREIGWT